MRRLADATLLYGYDSVLSARKELPHQAVWVAPNALYREDGLLPSGRADRRNNVIYVGRLVEEKKVDLLVKAFSLIANSSSRLTIVGDGPQGDDLKLLARELGCSDRVDFLGHIQDVDELKEAYSVARCSVSPGYAGLSLTQSLGFGVPVMVADNEPHAPEIELERFGGVIRFQENSVEDLARELDKILNIDFDDERSEMLSSSVRQSYSAEAMALGIRLCLENRPQNLGEDGWPLAV